MADKDIPIEERADKVKKLIWCDNLPWPGIDQDYKYEDGEGIDSVPQYPWAGRKFKDEEENAYSMPPPRVFREGNMQTVVENFVYICNDMRRKPEHVVKFLLAELGISGSVGQQELLVKGRISQNIIENVLRKYTNEYLICNECKSPNTFLSDCLLKLKCERCGHGQSVAQIKG